MRITVDMFSGRRNPSWVLVGDELENLKPELIQVINAVEARTGPTQLGFRGVILEATAEQEDLELGFRGRRVMLVDCRGPAEETEVALVKNLLRTAGSLLSEEMVERLAESIDSFFCEKGQRRGMNGGDAARHVPRLHFIRGSTMNAARRVVVTSVAALAIVSLNACMDDEKPVLISTQPVTTGKVIRGVTLTGPAGPPGTSTGKTCSFSNEPVNQAGKITGASVNCGPGGDLQTNLGGLPQRFNAYCAIDAPVKSARLIQVAVSGNAHHCDLSGITPKDATGQFKGAVWR